MDLLIVRIFVTFAHLTCIILSNFDSEFHPILPVGCKIIVTLCMSRFQIYSKYVINWEPRGSTKHQIEWRIPCSFVDRGVVSKRQFCKRILPTPFLFIAQRFKHVNKCAIHAFWLAIAHRMIWCRS